jgi:hypothetical protein
LDYAASFDLPDEDALQLGNDAVNCTLELGLGGAVFE